MTEEEEFEFRLRYEQEQSAPQEPRHWKDVPLEALSNVPSSAGNLASGLYQAVRHPIETGSNLLKAAQGGVINAMPDAYIDWLNKVQPSMAAKREEASKVGDAVGNFYKDRYGSTEGVKQTLATDPVGAAADFSAVLTGGSALTGKIPAVSNALKTGATYTNPVALAAKGISKTADVSGKLAANAVGAFGTHTGGLPIKQAFKSGAEGGKSAQAFVDNMRGNVPMTDVLDIAKKNVAMMGKAKSAEYRSGMAQVSGDKSVLGFSGIDKAVSDALNMSKYAGQVKNAKAAKVTQDIAKEVSKWKKLDPAVYHTPEGLDALKQKIGGIVEGISFEEKTARAAANGVYHSVKNEISKQAPAYAKTMKDYADATDQIREVERALSLGNKASIDTAMRKLQSLTRNNVNTNYGNRVSLAKTLEEQGGGEMMPALAGQALNTWVPRGLGGTVAGGVGLGGYAVGGVPGALGALAVQSPRLVGETAYKMGQAARIGKAPLNYMQGKGLDPATLANIMAISGGLLDPNRQQ